MNDFLQKLVEQIIGNVWVLLIACVFVLLLCTCILAFFWILCKSLDQAVKEFASMFRAAMRALKEEGTIDPGRLNVFMIVCTLLLAVLSFISQVPIDAIAQLLNGPADAPLLPVYCLIAFVLVCGLSPACMAALTRWASLTREPPQRNQSPP